MGLEKVAALLEVQSGVVSHAQLKTAGLRHGDIERLLRRRELVRVLPRVYVIHTGPLTWLQQAWAAVLWARPAALSHESAVRVADAKRYDTAGEEDPIHVAVAEGRRLSAVPGVVVHRVRDLTSRVQALSPPRVRLEHALLDLASEARTDHDAVGVLADAVGARRTTAARLLAAVRSRPRLAHRARIVAVLGDVEAGTCSALEQAFLELVMAHGLPLGERQASHRHRGDRRYRDVLLALYLLCIELDGRLVHGAARARDADLDRDLDAVADEDLLTVRLGWGQVVDRGCQTIERLGRILAKRGWDGTPLACSACRAAA